MRWLIIILFLIAVGEGLYIALNRPDVSHETSELDLQLRTVQANLDSVTLLIKAKDDSLDIAFLLLANQKIETQRAIKAGKQETKNHEQVTFKRFDFDTARFNAWARLYPTLFSH